MKSKKPSEPLRPFAFGCATEIFPPDELEVLTEYGNQLEALAAGAVPPRTAEHKHFLKVDSGEAEPKNVAERAWLRLKGRREFEQGDAAKEPLAPLPDYGMVEFDADRCWW